MFGKKLTKKQLGELRKLSLIMGEMQFKLNLVKGNTAHVRGGQRWCKTQEDIILILNNERENFIARCCASLGIEGKVSVDLNSGKIFKQHEGEAGPEKNKASS